MMIYRFEDKDGIGIYNSRKHSFDCGIWHLTHNFIRNPSPPDRLFFEYENLRFAFISIHQTKRWFIKEAVETFKDSKTIFFVAYDVPRSKIVYRDGKQIAVILDNKAKKIISLSMKEVYNTYYC